VWSDRSAPASRGACKDRQRQGAWASPVALALRSSSVRDAIVIGSGFGGAIAAARLVEAGHRVTVLELGGGWSAPGKARQTQDPRFVRRLLRDYPHDEPLRSPVVVTQGMGVGGGSLVYSGIHLRAPSQAFAGWPGGYTRATLDPYYARVERRLCVAAPADALAFDRPRWFAEGAHRAGLPPATALPLALAESCTRCGWCVPICAFGAKRTVQHEYLRGAARTGRLVVRAQRKAAYVARVAGRYRVWAWRTDGVVRDYHRVADGPLEAYDAERVIVAGGAIESPALLARSLEAELPVGAERIELVSRRLGRDIDGTGDFVQGGLVPARLDAFRGAVMMAHVDLGDFVLEDLHGLPAAATVALDARPAGTSRGWGLAYQQGLRDLGRHLLAIAIVGKSVPTLRVRDEGGNAVVSGSPYPPPAGSIGAARAILNALDARLVDTTWELAGRAITVHPTGGCAIGAVVRAGDLEVVGSPGLHVIDGSVLPGNPLRNPAHTIAAVAERALDVMLGVHARDDWPR
jgi:cholesterol oxidase